jgi:hypothetical protein
MTDYSKKYKTFPDLVAGYKPLAFKVGFVSINEHIPDLEPSSIISKIMLKLKLTYKAELTYFEVRHVLTPSAKKSADLFFITHYKKDHISGFNRADFLETLHYYRTSLRYFFELRYLNRLILHKPHRSTTETDMYILRWGYTMNVDPKFKEIIHGATSRDIIQWTEGFHS